MNFRSGQLGMSFLISLSILFVRLYLEGSRTTPSPPLAGVGVIRNCLAAVTWNSY